MPLKFQCNQDPRKMKTINGKKFCELCSKHVVDVRKKSLEKILELKKQQCCVILYKDQLNEADALFTAEKTPVRKITSPLPYAAGLAALCLVPAPSAAQDKTNPATQEQNLQLKNAEGKQPAIAEKKEDKKSTITFKGRVTSSPRKIGKRHKFELGYVYMDADSDWVHMPVLEFSSKADGKFSFELSQEQLRTMAGKYVYFETDNYGVNYDIEELTEQTTPILLEVYRGRIMGALF